MQTLRLFDRRGRPHRERTFGLRRWGVDVGQRHDAGADDTSRVEPTIGFDLYSPREIAERVEGVCIAKASTPLLSLIMLGMLAGAFIGLGSLFYVIVISDSSLGFAASRVLGGAVFSLGLLLVVVAGAGTLHRQQSACDGLGARLHHDPRGNP